MFGIILAFLASLLHEAAASIGKKGVEDKKESIYTMGFLNLFWVAVTMAAIVLIRGNFLFLKASLPTFGLRAALEILQAHMSIYAVVRADRSTYGFLRIWTIPLLLIADYVLGYAIGFYQAVGIGIIVFSFILLFINHGIKKNGAFLVLFTAVNAAVTISLFKYNITHFNSVEAEQGVMSIILMISMLIMARFVALENPLLFLKKPLFFVQSFSMGMSGVLAGFSYLIAPASIINTAGRSSSVLFSVLSGNIYFREGKFFVKLVAFILIAAGSGVDFFLDRVDNFL